MSRSDAAARWRSVLALGVAIGVAVSALVVGLVLVLGGSSDSSRAASADLPAPRSTTTTSTSEPRSTTTAPAPVTTAPHVIEPVTDPGGGAAPVSCPAPTKRVGTAAELQSALDTANAGDVIVVADGTYSGNFVLARSGSAGRPIVVCGSPNAILDAGGIKNGYVVHLNGVQYAKVLGLTVRNGQKGVVLDSTSNSVLQGLTVEEIGDEGIHLRTNSSHNSVIGNTVRRTGLRRDKFGEGIYVGSAVSNWPTYTAGQPDRSDDNLVQGNVISQTAAESIDIKEGTTGGRVIGNVMDGTGMTGGDSYLDVKGNNWVVEDNVGRHSPGDGIQTHHILDGWGSHNVFRRNVVDVDGNGQHFYIHDPDLTANQVFCDNRSGSGVPLRANVTCIPA